MGIVLQAYLPDASDALEEITRIATSPGGRRRVRRSRCAWSRARTWRWSGRGRAARLAAGALPDQGGRRRPLRQAARPRHRPGTHRRGAGRRRQPPPVPPRAGPCDRRRTRRRLGRRHRDAPGHGPCPGPRGAGHRTARCCCTPRWSPARTSTSRSPTWSAGWRRTPRRRTSCTPWSAAAGPAGSPSSASVPRLGRRGGHRAHRATSGPRAAPTTPERGLRQRPRHRPGGRRAPRLGGRPARHGAARTAARRGDHAGRRGRPRRARHRPRTDLGRHRARCQGGRAAPGRRGARGRAGRAGRGDGARGRQDRRRGRPRGQRGRRLRAVLRRAGRGAGGRDRPGGGVPAPWREPW